MGATTPSIMKLSITIRNCDTQHKIMLSIVRLVVATKNCVFIILIQCRSYMSSVDHGVVQMFVWLLKLKKYH